MEGIMSSIREGMEGRELPTVAGERRLEQSLFFSALRRHAKCAALDEAILGAWANSFGGAWAADIAKMRASDIASLGAYFWPNSADDKRAITLIKVIQWFTLVDDAYGDLHDGVLAHRLCDQLIHDTFEPGLPCPPPMIRGAPGHVHEKQRLITAVGWEWWQEMQQSILPSQRARFRSEFCQHLREQAHEVVFRERYTSDKKLPEVEEYILMRRVTSGFAACVTMVEYDVGIELNEEKLRNPQLKKLQEAVTDLACWINDILSFPKELAHGDLLNLLPVLHMRNINAAGAAVDGRCMKEITPTAPAFETAVSEAWRMIAAREEECAAIAHSLLQGNDGSSPSFPKYVETASAISVGVWAWTLGSARYKVLGDQTSHFSAERPGSPIACLPQAGVRPVQVSHRSSPYTARGSVSCHPFFGRLRRLAHILV